jgi:hypothetical protein
MCHASSKKCEVTVVTVDFGLTASLYAVSHSPNFDVSFNPTSKLSFSLFLTVMVLVVIYSKDHRIVQTLRRPGAARVLCFPFLP